MSQYSDSQFRARERVVCRFVDLWRSQAPIFKMSHPDILAAEAKIRESAEFKRLNSLSRAYVSGVVSQLFARHYDNLEWRINFNGHLVRSEEVPEGRWSETDGGEHVYKADPSKVF